MINMSKSAENRDQGIGLNGTVKNEIVAVFIVCVGKGEFVL